MKNLLIALFCATAIFTGCQKDTGINATITGTDLSAINAQLKGTWLFPVETFSIVDSSGKALQPAENQSAPAFQFDGNAKVNIMPDVHTVLKGTYSLTSSKGFIYLDVVNPDKTSKQYQILLVNEQKLKLNNTLPYVYYDSSSKPTLANAVFACEFTKQSAADITGNLVRVAASSDSVYSVKISAGHPDNSSTLLDTAVNIRGSYTFSYTSKHNDHVMVDLVGPAAKTYFYVYYNGLPLTGQMKTKANEVATSSGWIVP